MALFLRAHERRKDGKVHTYWSLVENRRCADGRVVQRHVLYLGALTVWNLLKLSEFWASRLPASREGTRWLNVLMTLVIYRLIDPGSEWRLHRQWYEQSALGDLL